MFKINKSASLTAACILLSALLLCWYLLRPDEAPWLSVETSTYALPGNTFVVRVTLTDPEPGLFLGADIHGMNEKKESRGYLSGAGHIQVKAGLNIYEFSFRVPGNADSAYIFPVIILSRDGTWSSRVRAAETDPVPVETTADGRSLLSLESRRAHDTGNQGAGAIPESRVLSMVISIAWLTAAVMLFRRRQGALWAASAISSAWEIFNSSAAAAYTLRNAALNSGLYIVRRTPQQVITVVIIIALAFFISYILLSGIELYRVLILTCIAAYWAISLMQVISFHEADRLLSFIIAGADTGQILRFAAAVTCTIILLSGRKKKGDTFGSCGAIPPEQPRE